MGSSSLPEPQLSRPGLVTVSTQSASEPYQDKRSLLSSLQPRWMGEGFLEKVQEDTDART
jgi:hypothetical protein